jgi:hypothetical protein
MSEPQWKKIFSISKECSITTDPLEAWRIWQSWRSKRYIQVWNVAEDGEICFETELSCDKEVMDKFYNEHVSPLRINELEETISMADAEIQALQLELQ